MNKDIHDQIKEILDRGEPIYSSVLGRVGQIMEVSKSKKDLFPVTICAKSRQHSPVTHHNHIHGATTFTKGDSVELVPMVGYWKLINRFRPL